MAYQLFTDATSDYFGDITSGLPPVEIVPMDVAVGDDVFTYGTANGLTVPAFYAMQRSGKFASTSQIGPAAYHTAFEPTLERGSDILYLCFTSGMSGTYQAARLAVEELREKFPERSILCVDTLCASLGEGFLVREAARKQLEGLSLTDLAEWVESYKLKVCHWFTVDTFEHLRHGGRVSTVAAAMGTMLQIKPLLHVDDAGELQVMDKPRGQKKAMEALLNHMRDGWEPSLGTLVAVGHGDCPDRAAQLKDLICAEFPDANVVTGEIGPVIGAHTGPGMLAVLYWGKNR